MEVIVAAAIWEAVIVLAAILAAVTERATRYCPSMDELVPVVNAPVMVTPVAVNAPAAVTENGADPFTFPPIAKVPSLESFSHILLIVPITIEPAVKEPMSAVIADRVEMLKLLAVIVVAAMLEPVIVEAAICVAVMVPLAICVAVIVALTRLLPVMVVFAINPPVIVEF